MGTRYASALNPEVRVIRQSTWIDNLDNKKCHLAGKLLVSYSSNRALFIQEDIILTNVVVGIKKYFSPR